MQETIEQDLDVRTKSFITHLATPMPKLDQAAGGCGQLTAHSCA